MRLITQVIKLTHAGNSLAEFIAARRAPGDGWSTWDEITIELHGILNQVITDVTLRKWATRYGIPENTRKDGSGLTSAADYAKALKRAGITI
jgi:hypothetical protein